MAAMQNIEKKCVICLAPIKGRSYRNLESETSVAQWGSIFRQMQVILIGAACNHCMNKLNKICRLTEESKSKVENMLNEKDKIINILKEMPGVQKQLKASRTPKVSKKRSIHEAVTPNTVTPKSKKSLFATPKRTPTPRLSKKPCMVEKGTQTKTTSPDFHVKVTVKYARQERSYIISDKTEQKMIKVLINKGTESAVCKHLSKLQAYRTAMKDCVTKEIEREVEQIVKRRESILRVTSIDDLQNFDWETVCYLLYQKVPTLMSVLRCVVTSKKKKCLPHLVTAATILLYGRNQTLNLLQFILGLVLDSGGLNKEGLSIVHAIGLTVSHTSVYNKRTELIKKQEENIDKVVKSYVRQKSQTQKTADTTELVSSMPVDSPVFESETQPSNSRETLSKEDSQTSMNITEVGGSECESTVSACIFQNNSCSQCTCRSASLTCQCNLIESNLQSVDLIDFEEKSTRQSMLSLNKEVLSAETQMNSLVSSQSSYVNEGELQSDKCTIKPIEILGDNLDITVSPTKMSMEHQRKSLHWFLTMVKQRQVTFEHAGMENDAAPQTDVLNLFTSHWIPEPTQIEDLHKDMMFHVAHILLKHIEPLQCLSSAYPEFILHPYMEQTKQKSVLLNCDLVDASENSSQGMIEILQHVHNLAVPHTEGKVIEKVVFGGDVLTNERAFSAQAAMQNNKTDADKLTGVVHRPEGLHRQFNFLLTIYQLFYKETSAVDRGSLYQLRNLISRRDVSGPDNVTQKFRPHQHFIEDVTDAYILASFWEIMDVEDENELKPKLPVFSIMNDDQKKSWLNNVSLQILDNLHLREIDNFGQLRQDLSALSREEQQLRAMKVDDNYLCPLCGRSYSSLVWFKKHLKKKHSWNFHVSCQNVDTTNAAQHFLFMSLIFRDTCDAYRLADGNRIIRNAHFEWLYASAIKHTKYKIWLWRMITYVTSILNVKDSFEYKWNMCVNLKGGIANNIPNDNAVEIQVCNIKRELNTQGANKSYQSARKICLTTQVVDSIRTQLIRTTRTAMSKRERPSVDKAKDINTIVQCLRNQGKCSDFKWNSFNTFKDPIQCIDGDDIHAWINTQAKLASVYL